MAIVEEFRRCLESPYLKKEPGIESRASQALQEARRFLDEALAKKEAGVEPSFTLQLAYQSMYKSLTALLYSKGYHATGIRCLLVAVEEIFVKPGRLDRSTLERFVQAQDLKGTAADHLAAAKQLLGAVRTLTSLSS